MLVKEKLKEIINSIEDEKKLKSYFGLISSLENLSEGELYQSLTDMQKEELQASYIESFDDINLVDHNDVRANFL